MKNLDSASLTHARSRFLLVTPQNFTVGVASLYDLASATPEHISRSFKKHLGVTPTQYINNQRLSHAANLLIRSDKTILDISLGVGFESLSHFYHLFGQKYKKLYS